MELEEPWTVVSCLSEVTSLRPLVLRHLGLWSVLRSSRKQYTPENETT
jgi:hypothetical protein